jgi:hypothetical protein
MVSVSGGSVMEKKNKGRVSAKQTMIRMQFVDQIANP